MYIDQRKYHYNHQDYHRKEIKNKLKTICHLNKNNSWLYPDLTTKPISKITKIIRSTQFALTWLSNRFYIFHAVKLPLKWLTNSIYQRKGINLDQSKEFLAEIKKCARKNFDFPIYELADQAANAFNCLFLKHHLTDSIQIPLLDTKDGEYHLNLFQSKLSDDAKYLGANRVEIGKNQILPRTLYHLLFVYFSLRNGNNYNIYPILKRPIIMQDECLSLLGEEQKEFDQTIQRFHPEILNFLKEKGLTLNELTWKEVKSLIDDINSDFEVLYSKNNCCENNLFHHFYTFCYDVTDRGAKFKEIALRALALEWESSPNTEIFYRSSQISADDIHKGSQHAHSLSFSSSLLTGVVFEGTPVGICPYVYYNHSPTKQLYALKLSPSKVEKYFFYPKVFKNHELLPLTASGEFSHPRLKVFKTEKTTQITGVKDRVEQVKKLGTFIPSLKIKSPEYFRDRIIKMFRKSIRILAVHEV